MQQLFILKGLIGVSLVGRTVKNLPVIQETWVQSLGQEDPLEKEIETHCSILAWEIPWTEKPGGLQSMRSQRVGHYTATKLLLLRISLLSQDTRLLQCQLLSVTFLQSKAKKNEEVRL